MPDTSKLEDAKTQQLVRFNRNHKAAVQFADKARDDYLLARLGLQYFLASGFQMSTQAVEKLLKSYVLFRDHALPGSATALTRAIRERSAELGRASEHGHNVEAALSVARDIGMPHSTDLTTESPESTPITPFGTQIAVVLVRLAVRS